MLVTFFCNADKVFTNINCLKYPSPTFMYPCSNSKKMFSCDTDLLSNGTISNLVLAGGVSKLPGYYEDTKNRIGISGIPLKVIQRAPRKSLLRKFGNRI